MSDLDDLFSSEFRHRNTRRVLEIGDDVHEFYLLALSCKFCKFCFEKFRIHTVLIRRNADGACAESVESLESAQVARELNDDFVAFVDENSAQKVKRLLACGRDDKVFLRDVETHLAIAFYKLFSQKVVTFGRAVLKSESSFVLENFFGNFAKFLYRESFGSRKTACKRNDSGFFREFEQLSDSRFFCPFGHV